MEIPNWAGLISASVHALSFRTARIDRLRTDLCRAWTNEGSIDSGETLLITVDLKMQDGDVLGALQTSARERLLSAHLKAHMRFGILTITERTGRSSRTVAAVRLRLKGNRNRVKWTVISGNKEKWIPDKTLLWPSSVSVDPWRLH
jgi:hypothetical protein